MHWNEKCETAVGFSVANLEIDKCLSFRKILTTEKGENLIRVWRLGDEENGMYTVLFGTKFALFVPIQPVVRQEQCVIVS